LNELAATTSTVDGEGLVIAFLIRIPVNGLDIEPEDRNCLVYKVKEGSDDKE